MIFYADAKTEDGYETVFETEAASKCDAWTYFEDDYPDCRILSVYTEEEARNKEIERERRLMFEMDSDRYDLY